MPTAEIITIGTELLLGEIQDTNTRHIARVLRNAGIDLYRTTIIGDNLDRIVTVVQEAIARSNIILTTGGLGPTVDDPTRNAIAKALGVELEFRSDLWLEIEKHFIRYGRLPTENNKKQAYIPKGAIPIENPVGTAPSFAAKTKNGLLISLPGVPREMEYLLENAVLPLLRKSFHLEGIIKTFSIHTSGAGESQIDELIGDLELLSNPTVGLVAYPGQIDIRVAAKAPSLDEANKMISGIVNTIDQRLGNSIFGYEATTLEQVVASLLKKEKTGIAIIEFGMDGNLSARLNKELVLIEKSMILESIPEIEVIKKLSRDLYKIVEPNIVLASILNARSQDDMNLSLFLIHHNIEIEKLRSFGGHINLVKPWAENSSLDFLRKHF
ncbi:MAG: competence/damage-inducible protein A [Anaerolineaceae bacterium]